MSEIPSFSEESEPKATESFPPPEPTASGTVSETLSEPAAPTSLPEKQPLNVKKRRDEFGKGLAISGLVNGLFLSIWPCYIFTLGASAIMGKTLPHKEDFYIFLILGLWMLVNLIAMITLAIKRRGILRGMVIGYATIFLITPIVGFCLMMCVALFFV